MKSEFLRKLIHLSSLWMVFVIAILEKPIAILFFSIVLVMFTVFEVSRMHFAWFRQWLQTYFGGVMREHEHVERLNLRALTGSFYFILAVLCSVILFDKPIAILAILVMILSDTAAALTGKSIGNHAILDKTIEGCIAFFITTAIILAFSGVVPSIMMVAIIAFITTCIELISNKIHVNDNLSITMSVGFLITLFI